jgi:hypothetical protein
MDQGLFGWLGMIFTSNGSFVYLSKCEQRRIENAPSFPLNKIVQIFIPRCFNLGISKRPNTSKKHWAKMENSHAKFQQSVDGFCN